MIPVNQEIVEIFRGLKPHEIEDAYSILLPKYRLEWAVCNAKPPGAVTSKSLDFAEAFHNRTDKSIFAAIGGNRSSKSFTAGWLCFALYVRESAQAGDVFWCIAQNLDRSMQGQQRELWAALPRWMFIHDNKMQEWTEKGGFGGHRKIILPCKGGGTCLVEFRSSDQEPDTFEQAKLRGAWVDEACPEWLLDRLLARIIDLSGWILFSDIRHQWWQEQRLIAPPPPQDKGVHCQIFCMRDNAHNLPPGAIAKARDSMTADEARMRIDGESGLSEGIVFKGFKDAQIILPFKIPAYWPKWRAIDYGSSAPTACLWFTINEEEEVYVYREYYEVSPSVAHSAKCISSLSPPDEEYRCTFIDPHAKDRPPAIYGMAPSVADQFAENGLICVGWPYIQIMGEHACVERIKLRDERGTIKVFSSCIDHIRERRNWKHACDKDGKPKAVDAYENENSHCLSGDTLVWTVEGKRRIADLVGQSGWLHTPWGIARFASVHRSGMKLVHHWKCGLDATAEHRVMLTDGSWSRLIDVPYSSLIYLRDGSKNNIGSGSGIRRQAVLSAGELLRPAEFAGNSHSPASRGVVAPPWRDPYGEEMACPPQGRRPRQQPGRELGTDTRQGALPPAYDARAECGIAGADDRRGGPCSAGVAFDGSGEEVAQPQLSEYVEGQEEAGIYVSGMRKDSLHELHPAAAVLQREMQLEGAGEAEAGADEGRWEMTYDLEVEGYHCFLANNGVCVSNSVDCLKGFLAANPTYTPRTIDVLRK